MDVTRFARVGVVTGYRLAAADKDFGARNVRGFTGGLQLQLGWLSFIDALLELGAVWLSAAIAVTARRSRSFT
jgi:hypothetical protein